MPTKKEISVEEFDKIFDEGKEDIMDYLDLDSAEVHYPDTRVRRVNVDFPEWMIQELDAAAERLAINRQAVIKTWIADRLKQEKIA